MVMKAAASVISLLLWILSPVLGSILARRKGQSALLWGLVCFLWPVAFFFILVLLRPFGLMAMEWLMWAAPLMPLLYLALIKEKEVIAAPGIEKMASSVPTENVEHPKKKRFLETGLTTVLLLALPFVGIYILVKPFLSVSRLGAYTKVIEKARMNDRPELFTHFPEANPPEADLIAFYHRPRFLQGGASWSARFRGKNYRFVNSVRETHGLKRGQEPNSDVEVFEPHQWTEVTRNLWKGPGDMEHWKDYDTVILKTDPTNKGHDAGIFISKDGRDAIFWARNW